ncbi:MAG TPA: TonB-dependent receptor [Paludibacteraceae bacterium]|nr:TonB-dependent receptor [Paludibacteraceae bacterium]HOS36967.1 TonB-dependent receptor [Paludibacteraceae bacterium]HPK20686.1 TonB-dependent receptor [Paludibacteraceae bacterium]
MQKKLVLAATLMVFGWVNAQTAANDSIELSRDLEEIVVSSTRMGGKTSQTAETFTADKLEERNIGVNLPYLLSGTPSLIVTSDDGLGVGYTYFRVRGTDQNRINMTINGVPLNDSESQTVFWVNMTDLAASMNSVNVQRGVGSSTNGASAFGASVNMQTAKTTKNPYAQIDFNGGMYNTFRESVKFGTGLMKNGFSFDARFSKVNSDGYVERAFSDLYSYYASGAWYGMNTMVKLMAFGGGEKTYMAWDGIDSTTLANNRRYNPAGHYIDDNGNDAFYDNQTDNYRQNHFQLHASHIFNARWNLNAALHYTYGNGYYEQYKENRKFAEYGLPNFIDSLGNCIKKSDIVRRKNLKNHFYGGVLAVNYTHRKVNASLGGAVNNYQGDHFGNVIWVRTYNQSIPQDFEYYRSQGNKFEANVYLKADWQIIKGLNLFGDLQYRYINYQIEGINDENLEEIPVHEQFHFFNPKAGISYTNSGHTAYFNFAIANREPNRQNYTEAGPNDLPLSERLYDYELGYTYTHRLFFIGANLYFMDYDNQLVLTGQYSDTGAYLTKNVKDSYRTGIELTFGVQPCSWFSWDGNITLSRNKIKNYSDWVDDWDADWNQPEVVANNGQVLVNYGTTDISFSPNITAGCNFQFDIKGFNAQLQTNYVGEQFLDNTMNAAAKLDDYCVTNLRLAYTIPIKKVIKNLTVNVQMNNLFNTLYVSNGGTYSYFEGASGDFSPSRQKYMPWYYAQAGFNIHAGFSITF